ncbi:hypothetical protein EJ04DRAFT_58661 [Polyplosphaeria fusca]|uniref:U4/U6 snRNA-associated-splicing factor PRP24 n=1 Tax=Polyplosphaeria fusca TaxID=682080 RepID=A0A9P4QM46_9PLEO|nr:hypothetical protein EJ04DRAFT_58661 [Polyplosphaeria fusca]
MQHQQQSHRQTAQVYAQRPSISLQNIPRTISGASASDIPMAEHSPKPPRSFASKALDAATVDMLNQLEKALKDNPFDYYSHNSFIETLHRGLQAHMNPADGSYQDPSSYELLSILLDSFQDMDSKYSLGETLWEYRLSDLKILARNTEERLNVLELFTKATKEEPHSAKLWALFGDYIRHLMLCASDDNPPEQWSAEDREIGKEAFTSQLLIDTLAGGAESVKYNIADSHLVWDRYLQALHDDLEARPHPDKLRQFDKILEERLGLPHATWDNTFSTFSTFTSRFHANDYQTIMQNATHRHRNIKKQYADREEHEFNLNKAIHDGDTAAEYHAMTRYLKWEKKLMGPFSFPLVNALYERATLRFPVSPDIWEDHIEFLIQHNNRAVSLLDVLERATRHCPWSGSLWTHHILTLEAETRSFEEIEAVKHSATETGMLEHTDIEELIKVQIAWCGYLRRKALDSAHSSEDDADIAEVGIRSALELVTETGKKKFGDDWRGDPKYRLERIHIKFWLQRGNVAEARQILDSLVEAQKNSYDFWYRYYIWEMVVWANHAVRDRSNAGHELQTPVMATTVLERALTHLTHLDQPEPLLEMYINHCEQHESVLKVRSAIIERRKLEKILQYRRQKEWEKAQESQAASASEIAPTGDAANAASTGKRKLEEELVEEPVTKKSRAAASDVDVPAAMASVEVVPRGASEAPSALSSAQPQRDREHASIFVRNLPKGVTQTRIRQFFSDVGEVRNVTIKEEEHDVTAHVEFATPEEAQYALMKEVKGFDGVEIKITQGESATLYVTNYPQDADEAYLRKLFGPYGEILEIRLPSLKFASNRRFCYIQYTSAQAATAATGLDGVEVQGRKLIAKISAPDRKKARDDATAEGREVYVWGLDFKVQNKDLKDKFRKFGKIENVKMPKHDPLGKGKSDRNKGFAYVVFAEKDHAEQAVAEMNGLSIHDREIKVQIAEHTKQSDSKPRHIAQLRNTESPGPERAASTPGEASEIPAQPVGLRSTALLDLPDTVNEHQIAKLVEPYGYKKITLMPKNGGATVEFTSVEAVGKANLALEGYEIIPGRKIRTGTVQELKEAKGEWRPKNNFIQPPQINRPTANRGGLRGRGRGKPGLGFHPGASRPAASSSTGAPKSNQDFRSMLLGGKKDEQATNGDNDTEMKDE